MITAIESIRTIYGESIDWQVEHILPAWILNSIDLHIIEMSPGFTKFKLGNNPDLFRRFPPPINVSHLCGQVIMAIADTVLVFPIIAAIGHGKEMATLDASTQFLSPVREGDITIEAKVIKFGRRAIRGVIDVYDGEGKHCATSMVCYMFVSSSNHHKEVEE